MFLIVALILVNDSNSAKSGMSALRSWPSPPLLEARRQNFDKARPGLGAAPGLLPDCGPTFLCFPPQPTKFTMSINLPLVFSLSSFTYIIIFFGIYLCY